VLQQRFSRGNEFKDLCMFASRLEEQQHRTTARKKAGQQQKQVENTGSQNGRKSKINENCIWSESQPSCNFLLLMVAF